MRKTLRYRIKDVGRPGHHYVEIKVLSGKGPRGGTTVGTLITKAELQRRVKNMWAKRRK